MKIQNTNINLSFNARNANIRFADDIARKTNKIFPRISSTNYEGFKYSSKYAGAIKKLENKIQDMREDLFFCLLNASGNYIEKSKIFTNIIKKRKIGNCHESAILGEITAKTNGIRNCFVAALKPLTGNPKDTHDHAVLYVDSAIKPYIIDPWLGFADYIPNALERYRKDFSKYFDFQKFGTEKMYFDMLNAKTPIQYSDEIKLKNTFPELIMRGNCVCK